MVGRVMQKRLQRLDEVSSQTLVVVSESAVVQIRASLHASWYIEKLWSTNLKCCSFCRPEEGLQLSPKGHNMATIQETWSHREDSHAC